MERLVSLQTMFHLPKASCSARTYCQRAGVALLTRLIKVGIEPDQHRQLAERLAEVSGTM